MNKSLVAVVIVAGAAAAITPKIISGKANSEFENAINAVNETPGYKLTVVKDQQGWFSTHKTLNFSIDPTQFDPSIGATNPEALEMFEDFAFDIHVDMHHGPILLSKGLGLSDIQIRIPNTSDEVTNQDQVVENIYEFDGKLNLLGNLSYEDAISAMQIDLSEDGEQLTFSGYKGVAKSSGGIVDYSGTAPSLDVQTPVMNMAMSDLTVTWNGEFDFAQLVQGIYGSMSSNFNIGSFDTTQASQKLFGWENLEFYVNSKVAQDNVADMQMGYKVASLDTPIEKFQDIEIAFEFNNFDQSFMKTWSELMLPGQNQVLSGDELTQKLKGPVLSLLTHKPELKITNIGLTTASGTLKSQAHMQLADYNVDESQFEDANFWQNNLMLDSSVTLPKALALDLVQKNLMFQFSADPAAAEYTPEQLQEIAAQQSQMMLDNFMQGGFLVEQNGELQLNFNVKGGTANLNGNDIPLAALIPAGQ